MHDDSTPDEQVQSSDDEDTENDQIPEADTRKDLWKPLPEEERPATPKPALTILPSNVSDVENDWASALASSYEPPAENSLLAKIGDMKTFLNWYRRQINKSKLTQANLEGQAYEVVKVFYPDIIHLQFQMEECPQDLTRSGDWAKSSRGINQINVNRPLPLGGHPGYVTIQTEFFFNKDLEYLRFGNKGSMHVLSISKMKAACYPDFGLELLVPKQMWIEDVFTYDISAKYAYSRYGYDYLSEIILRRADFQEHTIAEKDFKNLYPNDFKDMNLLLLQGHLDYLSGLDKRMLSTAVKLWTQNLVIRQRVEDFQLELKNSRSSGSIREIPDGRRFHNSDEYDHDPKKCEHAGPKVTTSHGGNNTTRMIWRFTVADDLKECSKIKQVKGTMLKDYYRTNSGVRLLRNSSGNSGPNLSFDKSTSLEHLFSLARDSLVAVSKLYFSFGCSGGDYTSLCPPNMDLYHSQLTPDDLNDLIIKYKIPCDLHPRLPSEEFVMSELPDDAIGIDLHTLLCPSCNDVVESLDHCFVLCLKVQLLWKRVFEWRALENIDVFSVHDVLNLTDINSFNGINKERWKAVIWSTLYIIWSNRNQLIFRRNGSMIPDLFKEVQLRSFKWISARSKKDEVKREEWFGGPIDRV
ncbi:hypothetical protein Tco_0651602 [Tanacetum coccineum]|uniref:DNA-directed RNA polymerase n=1 Tax=Tanacetum coccineum TaxID=301880 RepID=A0ABQ4WV85_9ASTR